uniref:TPM_phosphatase domain-containing protein n=2 Tax=Steinernema glaseri TaxID=37863 RepID=A0A1I7YPA6_9BILA
MLSLLSLLLTSGTILRADTEEWTPATYPNPRLNPKACNTWENSTLCDPDHILTDKWRADIDSTIKSIERQLEESDVQYIDSAHCTCSLNVTEPVRLYVVLAKRIKSETNESVSDGDLTSFGDELMRLYGLGDQECKNFLFIIGVQTYKAYVRVSRSFGHSFLTFVTVQTGKDLQLPSDMMERIFSQVTNLFNSRNYMEVLSKIIEETGREMLLAFKTEEATSELIKELSESTENPQETTDTEAATSENDSVLSTTSHSESEKTPIVTWILISIVGMLIVFSVVALMFQMVWKRGQQKPVETQTVVSVNNNDYPSSPGSEKRCYSEKTENSDDESCSQEDDNPYMSVTKQTFIQTVVDESAPSTTDRSGTDETLPQSIMLEGGETTVDTAKKPEDTVSSNVECNEHDSSEKKSSSRVKINSLDLSTDFIESLSPFEGGYHQQEDKSVSSKL